MISERMKELAGINEAVVSGNDVAILTRYLQRHDPSVKSPVVTGDSITWEYSIADPDKAQKSLLAPAIQSFKQSGVNVEWGFLGPQKSQWFIRIKTEDINKLQ